MHSKQTKPLKKPLITPQSFTVDLVYPPFMQKTESLSDQTVEICQKAFYPLEEYKKIPRINRPLELKLIQVHVALSNAYLLTILEHLKLRFSLAEEGVCFRQQYPTIFQQKSVIIKGSLLDVQATLTLSGQLHVGSPYCLVLIGTDTCGLTKQSNDVGVGEYILATSIK